MFFNFSYLYQRKRKINGHLQESCLLIEVQTEPCSFKGPKNFKFWTKNGYFGNFKHVLRFNFPKAVVIF